MRTYILTLVDRDFKTTRHVYRSPHTKTFWGALQSFSGELSKNTWTFKYDDYRSVSITVADSFQEKRGKQCQADQ